MRVRAVLRFVGGFSQIRSMQDDVKAGELANAARDISEQCLSDCDELLAVEWHVGDKMPCTENLFASFDRRAVGLFGYDFDTSCLAGADEILSLD